MSAIKRYGLAFFGGMTEREYTPPRRSTVWTLARQIRVLDVRDNHGRYECFSPRRGLWVSNAQGRLSAEMARRSVETFDERFPDESFDVLNDWSQLRSYESNARKILTNALRRHRSRIRSAHFFVNNRLVGMGVSAAGLALSFSGFELKSYGSAEKFDQAIARYFDRSSR